MLDRSHIVITGAASGIGKATARSLLELGYGIVAIDLNSESLQTLVDEHADSDLITYAADITDEHALRNLSDALSLQKIPVQGLVNCAGIASVTPFEETTPAMMRKLFDINVVGALLVSQALAPHLRDSGHGAIVNIASVSGILGNYGRAAYGASKGALIALTKVMALELAEHTRVNAIAPGPIATPLTENQHGDATRQAWLAAVPQKRYGSPDDIANLATFLIDDSKSSFITGQVIAADGGFTTTGVHS